jgi:hypothetical protein
MKKCTKCLATKSRDAFNKAKKNKDGLNTWCRACTNEYSREWARKNKKRHQENYNRWRKNNLEHANDLDRLRSYGLPRGRYKQILEIQKGCCAICKTNSPAPKKTFCVDHCHKTGKVRGLLCHKCNTMIGHAKDNIQTLKNAIDFLVKDIDYREEKWGRLGEFDEYFWKIPNELASEEKKESGNSKVAERVSDENAIDSLYEEWERNHMARIISHWKEFAPDQRLDGKTWEENMRKALGTKFDR